MKECQMTDTAALCDIGFVGAGVMGKNLILNLADNGYRVAAFDLDHQKLEAVLAQDTAPPALDLPAEQVAYDSERRGAVVTGQLQRHAAIRRGQRQHAVGPARRGHGRTRQHVLDLQDIAGLEPRDDAGEAGFHQPGF